MSKALISIASIYFMGFVLLPLVAKQVAPKQPAAAQACPEWLQNECK